MHGNAVQSIPAVAAPKGAAIFSSTSHNKAEVVCGYIFKDHNMASIMLGQYEHGGLSYKGHVTLGVSGADFQRVMRHTHADNPPVDTPDGHGNERAEWILPDLVCTLQFMERTANGGINLYLRGCVTIRRRPTAIRIEVSVSEAVSRSLSTHSGVQPLSVACFLASGTSWRVNARLTYQKFRLKYELFKNFVLK